MGASMPNDDWKSIMINSTISTFVLKLARDTKAHLQEKAEA
jgi:hypothetical protein